LLELVLLDATPRACTPSAASPFGRGPSWACRSVGNLRRALRVSSESWNGRSGVAVLSFGE